MRLIRNYSLALFCLSGVAAGAWAADKPAPKAHPGAAIYKEHCAACHGEKGKPAVPGSPDFSSKAWLKKAVDAKLIKATTDGTKNMPGFKEQLKAPDIKSVVAFVKTLAK